MVILTHFYFEIVVDNIFEKCNTIIAKGQKEELKPMEKKNLLVLYTHEECDSPKECVELYNVDSFEHIMIDERSYLRVVCDGKYYYFKTQLTAISSFVNYQR